MGFWSTQFSSGNQPYMPLNPTCWEHILRVEDEYPEPKRVFVSIAEQIRQDIDREVLSSIWALFPENPSADCPTAWWHVLNVED